MTKYLVTLEPIDDYYFGGDKHFSHVREDGRNKDKANYFVRSRVWPQQTAILGLLRHQLLIRHNLIPLTNEDNQSKASELIGANSFVGLKENDFGVIKGLSEVFMTDKEYKHIILAGSTNMVCNKNNLELAKLKEKKGRTYLSHEQELNFVAQGVVGDKNFSSKNHQSDCFIKLKLAVENVDEKNETTTARVSFVKKDSLLKEQPHKGIHKKMRSTKDQRDQSFYKQYTYRFQKSEADRFGVFVEIANDAIEPGVDLVRFGGEGKTFKMTVHDAEKTQQLQEKIGRSMETISEIRMQGEGSKAEIFLLSDTYINNPTEFNRLVTLGLAEAISFRNVFSTVEMENFANLSNKLIIEKDGDKEKHPYRAKQCMLLKRGSIICCTEDNLETVEELLAESSFQHIGYNKYIVLSTSRKN